MKSLPPVIPPPPICLAHNVASDGPCPKCERTERFDLIWILGFMVVMPAIGTAFLLYSILANR